MVMLRLSSGERMSHPYKGDKATTMNNKQAKSQPRCQRMSDTLRSSLVVTSSDGANSLPREDEDDDDDEDEDEVVTFGDLPS